MVWRIRHYGTFSLAKSVAKAVQPSSPVRTRFAPSPTGYLHLGSLRTALYNYLLARSTGGSFLLRLEDTDQKRLVPDAEERIYRDLHWLGLDHDEGPVVGGEFGPYRQSERGAIYEKYIQILLEKGLAYRCYCSKERLDGLRESARLLKPPTTVSYDRHCSSNEPEIGSQHTHNSDFTVRFKSPAKYPKFTDLLHGRLDLQPQINAGDVRYDDFVLMKSDGLPTYHFANVVDDHLMGITHVIRGEEWLPSTPKHLALYDAFGWEAPHFVHIPLLTSSKDKKLSKRSGDIDVAKLRAQGYVRESLINFSALYGWSPKRTPNEQTKEVYSLSQLEQLFSLDGLTKGNAKVDFGKLNHFNKHYLELKLKDPQFVEETVKQIAERTSTSLEEAHRILKLTGSYLTKLEDLFQEHDYLFGSISTSLSQEQIEIVQAFLKKYPEENLENAMEIVSSSYSRQKVFKAIRMGLSGKTHGIKLPSLFEYFGPKEVADRLRLACK
ncbi:unnamed protein product [Kuraishia capsulata CBS 1993]|uniref:Glutamate--tRNA ligase, mitochondrial n=1 Tax=Kuraishia capsulata CBS 1993 TaxID=1382522 RepID=W6MSP3_9ASCO|nr:uncharacterized protein KUCA_T00005825001 [Kuraishia capsulata CBS 1993]CDK29831.1 unnamed protein product [Kuraishia capsulata CBS 1993]